MANEVSMVASSVYSHFSIFPTCYWELEAIKSFNVHLHLILTQTLLTVFTFAQLTWSVQMQRSSQMGLEQGCLLSSFASLRNAT